MQLIRKKMKKGYIVLVTVLVVGVVSSASAIAILLLGLSIERNAYALQLSTQAFTAAWSCAEHAIDELKDDLEYGGNEVYSIEYAYPVVSTEYGYAAQVDYDTTTCTIYPVGGFWNENRTICTEAVFGNYTRRRLEVELLRVHPDVKVKSWEEVDSITLCDAYSPPSCGNGTVDTDEECDDGNTTSDDGCSSNCLTESCGDGIVQNNGVETTEQCDAAGESSSCNSDCTTHACGDGVLNTTAGEECDDGNTSTDDGCNASCQDEECGDGIVQAGIGEQCDDGDTDNNDGCSSTCQNEVCGDNITQSSEDCDTGAADSATCDADCSSATCGDGYVNSLAGEDCDDSGESATCNNDCTNHACGDGVLNATAGEQCDDGDTSSGDGCSATCQTEACGDGVIDSGEQCDDGNTDNNDGCSSTCQNEVCGDNIAQTGEDCDDGGESASCDSDCTTQSCGDGTTNTTAGEECDDGNTSSGDGCSSTCQTEECGDGTVQAGLGETCDDGNTTSGDGCDSSCIDETSSPTDYALYWKFDESSGDPADSSGNGYGGTAKSGAGTTSDVPTVNFSNPYSRDFDGQNDRIELSSANITTGNAITVSFWTKNDTNPSQYDGIVCKTNNTSWTRGWGFFYNSSSNIRFFIEDFSTNASSTSISAQSWNHVAGVWDGSTITIYVNGTAGSTDSYSGSMGSEGRTLTVGNCGSNSFNIDGKVDDLRIYNRALTLTEITALANGN